MSHRKPLHQISKDDIQASEAGHRWLDRVSELVLEIKRITVMWNPAALAANTHVEQTVTVTGLRTVDDIIAVIKPTFTQGFQVGQGRVSASNTLAIQIANGTGSSSNPGSEIYIVYYVKNCRGN